MYVSKCCFQRLRSLPTLRYRCCFQRLHSLPEFKKQQQYLRDIKTKLLNFSIIFEVLINFDTRAITETLETENLTKTKQEGLRILIAQKKTNRYFIFNEP